MRLHRIRAALAASVLVPLALAGCSNGSSEKATVRVWVVGSSTPQEARDYLETTFEEQNPGATLHVEEQPSTDLVDKLETALNSASETPDVVEMANTQAPTLTSGGYLAEIPQSRYQELGGLDLIQSFVDIGTWKGKIYAVPYFAAARVVFYSPGLVARIKADFEVPTTLDTYEAVAQALTTDTVSGLYWPGQDWHNLLPYIWEHGGFIAQKDGNGGTWKAGFSTEGSIAGLTQAQRIITTASHAGAQSGDEDPTAPFCQGQIALVSTVPSFQKSVQDPAGAGACGGTYGGDLTAFALPSLDGSGPAHVFADGSNLGIAAKSKNPDLAYDALGIMLSDKYQAMLSATNLAPAKVSLAATVPQGDPVARSSATAASNSMLTPATPRWAEVESRGVMSQAMVRIAQGENVATVAADLDRQVEAILNG